MKNFFSRITDTKAYKTIYYYIDTLLEKFDKNHLWIMSSGIAFNFFICIIPFTLLLLTILGFYLDSEMVQSRLIGYLNNIIPLPGQYKDRIIFELTQRTQELSANAFLTLALGMGGLFWTASGLFSAMREVLRRVFKVSTEISFVEGKLRDFLLVIVSVILFILTMAITSSVQIFEEYSQGLFGEMITLTLFEKFIPMIVGFLITFTLFYVLYKFVPHTKINKRVVLYSTFISSIFFEALKYLFSIYILKIANYGKIYGAYATIVISIFYIYYVSVIFVVGAEMGEIYFERNKDPLGTLSEARKKKNKKITDK